MARFSIDLLATAPCGLDGEHKKNTAVRASNSASIASSFGETRFRHRPGDKLVPRRRSSLRLRRSDRKGFGISAAGVSRSPRRSIAGKTAENRPSREPHSARILVCGSITPRTAGYRPSSHCAIAARKSSLPVIPGYLPKSAWASSSFSIRKEGKGWRGPPTEISIAGRPGSSPSRSLAKRAKAEIISLSRAGPGVA